MNFTTPLNYQQNMALLFSAFSNMNQSFLPSSTQEGLQFPFNQGLFNMGFGGKDFESLQRKMRQGLLSTSPSSDDSKGGMEEESENSTNMHLKKPIFTITRQNKLSKNLNVEPEEPKPCVSASGNYSRKEKSLGELSKRFLTMFGRVKECLISLDSVTKQLDVERRRVYDIINILESLGVVYRKGKNNYQWSGLDPIRETIRKLETRSLDFKQEEVCEDDDSSEGDNIVDQRLANKKEKSLAYLAGSFIKLFFSWKETIPLEEAAWKLSPKDIDDHKIKTKIRRLYDIANVFSSLGLIKKINLDTKKPAFKWIGNEGLDEFVKELNNMDVKREVVAAGSQEKSSSKKKLASGKKTAASVGASGVQVKTEGSEVTGGNGLLNNILNVLMSYSQPQPQPKPQSQYFDQFVRTAPVPIIQRPNENQATSSLNGKRGAAHSIGGFEVQNMKKMKENFSFETKVEN